MLGALGPWLIWKLSLEIIKLEKVTRECSCSENDRRKDMLDISEGTEILARNNEANKQYLLHLECT